VNAVFLPLFLTLCVQILVSGASLSVAVLAPLIGPDLAVPTAGVGYYVAVLYGVAAVAGLASGGLIQRLGALGTMQVTLCCGALGQILLAIGTHWSVALAAIACGFSLGPTTPASSAILVGATQSANRNLVFSLKQTGVPGGFMLAALSMPPLALALGWRGAAAATACVLLAAALAIAPWRERFASGRTSARPAFSLRAQFVEPLQRLWAMPELRRLGLASASYSGLQGALAGFLVAFLVHDTTLDLIAAAGVLAAAQAAGVVCRVLWGAVADRSGRPDLVLGLLGLAMAGLGSFVGLAAPHLSYPLLLAACILFGATSTSWNGVYLGEVARIVPPDRVGEATGATGLFTFGGVAVVPGLFATIVLVSDSYALAYLLAAAAPAAFGIALLRAGRAKGIGSP
jgi:MFS family permease